MIVIGDGNFTNSGVDRKEEMREVGGWPTAHGGLGETGNTFYLVTEDENGNRKLVAYDPVKEETIEATHGFSDDIYSGGDVAFEGVDPRTMSETSLMSRGTYTNDNIRELNNRENVKLREYCDRNGYSNEFYNVLVNQRFAKNPYERGTVEHQTWNEKFNSGNFVWDEANNNFIRHSLGFDEVDEDYFGEGSGLRYRYTNQAADDAEGTYDKETLTLIGMQDLSVLKNNPFNPDNPDLTRRQRQREQRKSDAWIKQATLRNQEGSLIYRWDPNTRSFEDPITEGTTFNQLGYDAGTYTNTKGDRITIDANGRAFIEKKISETPDGIEYADPEEMLATGQEWQDLELVESARRGLIENLKDPIVASSLVQTVLGGVGLGMAMKDVDPMQMPTLSAAFEERLRQSEDLAKQGFSPAEEAKVRQDIRLIK